MAEFFDDEFGITIYQDKYAFNGTSKAKHLRAFVATEDAFIVAHVLRSLWNYREGIEKYRVAEGYASIKERFFGVLAKIEQGGAVPQIDAIYRFKHDETLEELIAALQRDIGANKPIAALDRLHTYCMKKFGYLLHTRNVAWDRNEPLHSRVGKYAKVVSQERELRDITTQIIKSAISIFEKFNHVRNNQSLAHDNDLLSAAEVRFIYDTITAFLRFIKAIEANRFDP
jgi:hypothetical protein